MDGVCRWRVADVVAKIRSFIIENYLFGDEGNLGNDDSFMESGIIDSTGILELVRFLEATFLIKISDEELIPDNLDSINKIVRFLQAKLALGTSDVDASAPESVSKVVR
jgi:acyl carrier protein